MSRKLYFQTDQKEEANPFMAVLQKQENAGGMEGV